MTLSAARNTDQIDQDVLIHRWKRPVKAATVLYPGQAAVLDGGYLCPARSAAGLISAGMVNRFVDNSAGSSGALWGEVNRGCHGWDNSSGGDLIAETDAGKVCYWADDHTVAKTDANGTRSPAGRIMFLEGGQVFVECAWGADASPVAEGYGNARGSIVSIPVTLAQISAGQVIGAFTPGFSGRLLKTQFIVTTAATTAAKAATLQPRITGVATTGGALALTSANMTPVGNVVQGSAITALNEFGATDTIDVQASSVTAFIEGAGVLLFTLA